jgi:hypothetical protein
MTGTQTNLSDRELATVLAALHYSQQDLPESDPTFDQDFGPDISRHFQDDDPLTVEEIDKLYKRLQRRR